ncbi:SAM-dependent methyltransferase [Enterocloster sp. OA13]|uniref:Eco57I restriction-modification methylase domain-containing protein n=1 Tax=Enterocloster sp. OA13 TaxID=2914161 RepID=UPI001F0634D4|nr:SAM-dependent methyltransferase [Enterocloster sp. OA13]
MSKQNKNCKVPTPKEYVEIMLNQVGYIENLYGRKVIENSCGEGNILIEIVRRYIKDCKKQGYSCEKIAIGLSNDIIAYEIDKEELKICRKKLNNILKNEHIKNVHWKLRNSDYLKSREKHADFIIGNPPYITYHDLDEKERKFVQNNFEVCKKGRFDYCYAFIEASIKSLGVKGKLAYLIPYSIFKNKFANELRDYIKPYLTRIYDYKSIKIFPRIISTSAIIICEKNNTSNMLNYELVSQKLDYVIEKQNLGPKWVFIDNNVGTKRFGDFFKVANGVATLYNKAFLIERYVEDELYYYVNGMKIEKSLLKTAVSSKSLKNVDNDLLFKIIFPYKIEGNKIKNYTEEEFLKNFPQACLYLQQFKAELGNRKADKNAKWFEYGRSQSIYGVFGKKLIIPMVITNNVVAYEAEADSVPYAGYFIKQNSQKDMTLTEAKQILESNEFYKYVREHGTPTTVTSYRISVKDISDFMF